MLEQIKKMVADNLGVEESKITENASFKDDLGADSLDLFESRFHPKIWKRS